jgi:Zn-dependent M28 family amino/carboxypeptidase
VEETLAGRGYAVQRLPYTWRGGTFRNLVVELPGAARPDEVVVFGAHYDTVPQTPGADDNASAVAALLELAGLCRDLRPARTVRFVAFTLEEPPAFFTPHQGSRVYARALRQRRERVAAMVALEMLGYYSDEPHSQHFPLPPLRWFYPHTGNFAAVIGNLRSYALTRRVAQAMRGGTDLPVEWLAAPAVVPGLALSDHASFWLHGYPAVMVTDTAFFRNPHYHRPSDRPETLDFGRLARCVQGLERVVRELGGV